MQHVHQITERTRERERADKQLLHAAYILELKLPILVFLSLASLDQLSPQKFTATVRTPSPNWYQLLSVSTELGSQASHVSSKGATIIVTFHIDW